MNMEITAVRKPRFNKIKRSNLMKYQTRSRLNFEVLSLVFLYGGIRIEKVVLTQLMPEFLDFLQKGNRPRCFGCCFEFFSL